jgi:hypothetical protein
MPIDNAAGKIFAALLAKNPERRAAFELAAARIIERLPAVQADHERAAAEWRELTGSPLPSGNDGWVEAAACYGVSTDRAIDGDFTPRNVFVVMKGIVKGMRARLHESAGVRGPSEGKSNAPETWLALAMLAVQRHPGWSDSKIAEKAGVHRSTVSRSRTYVTAAAIAREPKVSRSGYRDDSGSIVAVDEPASLPVDGEPIAGSKYFRATCAECGDRIRVPRSELENPRCEGCSE